MSDRKTIFITGAASGIGAATAELFSTKGWIVGLFDIDEAGLEAVHAGMPADRACHRRLDVRCPDDWAAAVTHFAACTGGRMDVLLNNAGIGHSGPFDVIPAERHTDIIATNLSGVTNGIAAALPLLKGSAPARIINVASAAGLYGLPSAAVYGATKAAVINLSQALDIELAPHSVSVSCVMPWFVDTPILDGVAYGSNATTRDNLSDMKETVYPVSRAADVIWAAAQSRNRAFTVGREAGLLAWMSRMAPGATRRFLQWRLADRITPPPGG